MTTDDALTPDQARLSAEIAALRTEILDRHVLLIRSCDLAMDGQWAVAVRATLSAGVSPQAMSQRFSCAVSTVRRWEARQSSPARFARTAMQGDLVEMVEALRAPREGDAA
jgi:DNA-binding transcriptional regulator YiaG